VRTAPSYVAQVRHKYSGSDEIWLDTDRWHQWTRRQIKIEMALVSKNFDVQGPSSSLILDIGSGGYAYFQANCLRIDVDIAEPRLSQSNWGVCANVEILPFPPEISDLTICVGPVINYCSLDEAIYELARTIKKAGRLVLHVELSNSWEFIGTKAYRADAAFVTTFYKGTEQYWVYSNEYVRRMLALAGFAIERVKYFHLLSSLAYRLTRRANLASYLAPADWLLDRVWKVGSVADSAIFVCRRIHST
jgi:hypothetical protein